MGVDLMNTEYWMSGSFFPDGKLGLIFLNRRSVAAVWHQRVHLAQVSNDELVSSGKISGSLSCT